MIIAQLHWKKKLGLFCLVLGFAIGLAIFGGQINGGWAGFAVTLTMYGLNNLIRDPSVTKDTEGNFPFGSKK
jgi:hypothetical protein